MNSNMTVKETMHNIAKMESDYFIKQLFDFDYTSLSIAKRQTKRLGLQDCKMEYHINENDQFYSVIVHTGEIK